MPNLSTISLSASSPLNQFLFRQLGAWLDQPLNLIGAPANLDWQQLAHVFAAAKQPVQVWTNDWRSVYAAQAVGIQVFFTAEPSSTRPWLNTPAWLIRVNLSGPSHCWLMAAAWVF